MARLVSAEVAISDREVSGFELVFDALRRRPWPGIYPIMAEPALRPARGGDDRDPGHPCLPC